MKNDDNWIGKKGFRYWYYRYRDSQYYSLVMIALTIIVCSILLFQIIIPEVGNWFSIRKEVIATQDKIAVLQNNINFLGSLDKPTLNAQLDTAATALPPEKDFGSMLDVISNAAVTAGVSLNDYAFQVGNIASSSGQITDVKYNGLASIKITLIVSGSLENVKRFITTVEKSIPIAEVTNVDGSGENVSISVQFYQKPFPNVDASGSQPLQQVSADKLALLQKLKTWKHVSGTTGALNASASNSAIPLF